MAERVEDPIKYDSLPNYPAEGFAGTDLGPTRVPRDSPVRTTPLPPQTWFQRHEALLIGSSGVAVFFIAWLGIGVESKIAVIYLGAVFAILINTMAGVRSLDASLLRVARSFGAGDLHIFRTIALPGSVPFILTGLRLGTGHALIGVVVAEYVAAQHGLGRMMMIAGSTFQSSKVFVGLFLIAAAGLLLTYGLQRIERHFDAWRPQR